MCTKLRSMDISIKWFNFLQTWKENLIHLTQHATLGLHAWDAMHRRGAMSEARSEPTGRATHVFLHQDKLCCTPPEWERSAAYNLSSFWPIRCSSTVESPWRLRGFFVSEGFAKPSGGFKNWGRVLFQNPRVLQNPRCDMRVCTHLLCE